MSTVVSWQTGRELLLLEDTRHAARGSPRPGFVRRSGCVEHRVPVDGGVRIVWKDTRINGFNRAVDRKLPERWFGDSQYQRSAAAANLDRLVPHVCVGQSAHVVIVRAKRGHGPPGEDVVRFKGLPPPGM